MIGIIYDNENKELMENELSSLQFQRIEDIELVKANFSNLNNYDIIITDSFIFPFSFKNIKFVVIIYDENQVITITKNIIMIQYESKRIKFIVESKYPELNNYNSVIINRIPKQKIEIKPLETQDATIFYHGIDTSKNMIDEMFTLDRETYYNIKFYDYKTKEIPSKKHRLSWNVTTNVNEIGIISNKIIKEIENGCLPILLKENAPEYFKSYPFFIELDDIKSQDRLIKRVKEISHFISKMTREEFASLANSIYNGIYVHSKWNYNFFLITEEINRHIK